MIENISGVARTAYYCCGVRAADAGKREPICGDHLASLFMDEAGQEVFGHFADLRFPNASNATRARIIDDWLRDRLLADPEQLVIFLGAGFDTRAFRLNGGRWVEVDEAGLIAEKERVLPAARAPQPLTRLAVDFSAERLEDRLAPYEGEYPVIVMEGVSMYLSQAQLKSTLSAVQWVFPRHTLICDLMRKAFAERYAAELRKRLAALGTSFAELPADPVSAIAALGYRPIARSSIMARARELGAVPFPKFLLNTLLRPLRDGYCAHVFEAGR
ncbi:class I SAM-dependent methyltransferase [Aestuariivirga sp.]|uniref:class I SAM-dependent methyltransferase n=1 Tax=Aestuariivirga sp. TaxID=2650926 RepID=UPI00391A0E87